MSLTLSWKWNSAKFNQKWLQFYRQAFSWSFCISVLNWNFSPSFYIKHVEIKIRSLWCVSPSSNQLGHVLGEPYCVPNYTIPVIGVWNGMACSLPWWYKYLHAVTAMTYTTSTYMPVLFLSADLELAIFKEKNYLSWFAIYFLVTLHGFNGTNICARYCPSQIRITKD